MSSIIDDTLRALVLGTLLGVLVLLNPPASTAQCEWGYTYGITP